jgi:hypothetical protein
VLPFRSGGSRLQETRLAAEAPPMIPAVIAARAHASIRLAARCACIPCKCTRSWLRALHACTCGCWMLTKHATLHVALLGTERHRRAGVSMHGRWFPPPP